MSIRVSVFVFVCLLVCVNSVSLGYLWCFPGVGTEEAVHVKIALKCTNRRQNSMDPNSILWLRCIMLCCPTSGLGIPADIFVMHFEVNLMFSLPVFPKHNVTSFQRLGHPHGMTFLLVCMLS